MKMIECKLDYFGDEKPNNTAPMKKTELSLSSSMRTVIISAVSAMALSAQAATLTWDADPSTPGPQDGSGVWDHSNNNWWSGSANTTWNSAGPVPDAAVFGANTGLAGTVTLGANIVSSNITFNPAAAGWYSIIGGGYTLALTNRTITPNVNATIAADIVGSGPTIVANAGGVLTLSGNNSMTGTFQVGPNAANTTCAVRATSSTAFGFASPIVLNDQGNQTSPRIELVGGVTITNRIQFPGRNNVSSAFISISGANTLSGPITNQAGGVLYIFQAEGTSSLNIAGPYQIQTAGARTITLRGTGNGTISGLITGGSTIAPTNTLVKAGTGIWTISGTNNYIAPVVVVSGTLRLDYSTLNDSKLSDSMPVYLVGGSLDLNGGTHTEVVSSNIIAGGATVTRSSGSSVLRMNAIQRLGGGVIDFGQAGIADTDTLNVNGILGGYATVGRADWAANSIDSGDGPVTPFTGYTDIAATGSTIADSPSANVRLNSAGSGGNIALGSVITTINTLLQNTTTAATIDAAGKTLRLGATGGVLIPPGKQSLTIGTAADSGTLTAGGANDLPGEIILINYSTNPLTVNATIADNDSGSVALTVAGSGSVTLTGNNTHTGTNYISGGTLNISSSANLGTGPVVINGGVLSFIASTDLSDRTLFLGPPVGFGGAGTIRVAAGQTATISSVIANYISGLANPSVGPGNSGILGIPVGATLIKDGPGTLVLGGANTYSLGTIINEGTLGISDSANLGPLPGCYIPDHLVINGGTLRAMGTLTLGGPRGIMLGPVGASGAGTIEVDDYQTLTIESRITDNWGGTGTLVKTGNGTLVLSSGLNDYSGDTIISAGTLQLNHFRALPNGPGKGNLINNGTLALNNVSPVLPHVTGSGAIDHLGANAVTLTIGANNTDDTVSGGINNSGGGPVTLLKAGTGTLTLGGSSTYSGATRITGGTLKLAAGASIASTTNIVVGSGAVLDVTSLSGATLTLNYGQTLSGSGTVQGSIADSSGATIAPGISAGTLTINGNLTLGGGGNLEYELANVTTVGSGVNDLLIVTGTLTVSGPTTLDLKYLQGVPAGAGKYTLIQYGNFSGNVNNISAPAGFVVTNNTAAKAIELVVIHEPMTLTWRGDGVANIWDTGITANWLLGGSSAMFYAGDTAVFDDSGYNSPAIYISGTVFPGATIVNATQDYTFTGGTIGSGSLTKSGSGTLILENDNVFSVGIQINTGTVQVGNGGSSGTLTGSIITNDAALVYNRADDVLEVTNAITGSGSVTQAGVGGVTISSSNSYDGLTVVSAGILHVRNSAALGTTNAGTIVADGAQLYIDRNVNITNETLTISGAGPGTGALRKGGAGLTTFTGPVTLSADTTINVDGGATLALMEINGPGLLTKDGTGALALLGPNTSGGIASVNNGELIIGHNNALGPTTNLVVYTSVGGAGITGTRITVANGTIVSNVQVNLPSDASYRSALFSRGTGGVTNIWNGPVAFAGYEGTINFGTEPGAVFVINGPVTNEAFTGVLLLRGTGGGGTSGTGCTGIISGPIIFEPTTSRIGVDDGSTWIISSTGNRVRTFNITSGVLKLGTNNALPTDADLTFGMGGVAAETFDLAGFNQTLGSITTLSSTARVIGNSSTTSDSLLTLAGAYSSLFGGVIQDALGEGTRRVALTLTGGATLTLTNVNTYSGDTTINPGCNLVLANDGAIPNSQNIFIGSGAAIDVTGRTDGTLTVTAVQTLKGNGTFNVYGNVVNSGIIEMKVDKTAGALSGDLLTVSGNITYGGGLRIVSSGGPYALGDSIQLFQVSGTKSGNFAQVLGSPGPGLGWSFNPATGIATVVVGIPTTPTNISYSLTATNITISWPNTHVGWVLQVQTNALNIGISTNWIDVPGSASTNAVVFPVSKTNGTVFFRLRYP